MHFKIIEFRVELKMENTKGIFRYTDYTSKSLKKLHTDLKGDPERVREEFKDNKLFLESCIAHIKSKLEDYEPFSPSFVPFIAILSTLTAIIFGFINFSNLDYESGNNVLRAFFIIFLSVGVIFICLAFYDFYKTSVRKKFKYILSYLESFR